VTRPTRVLTALLMVAASLAAAGCEPRPAGPLVLTSSAQPPFVDVPVPMGFEREEDKSMARTSDAGRVAHLVYWGKAPVQAVSRFYKKEMTRTHGWTRGPESLADGAMEITFTKAGAIAVVRIEPCGGKSGIKILVGGIREPAPGAR
jgi:hypothetical protein